MKFKRTTQILRGQIKAIQKTFREVLSQPIQIQNIHCFNDTKYLKCFVFIRAEALNNLFVQKSFLLAYRLA